MPFTPNESIAALRYMYDTYKNQIWMQYGFRDAFNLNQNWWGPDVIGIDEGPIIVMIENYRTGRVWNCFMQNADIQRGLQKAGFSVITDVQEAPVTVPAGFRLDQNYPNPFNPTTTIRYSLPKQEHVILKVFDILGREVATLVDEEQDRGEHAALFGRNDLAAGLYFYSLTAGKFSQTRKAVLLK
jgi:hypothetical protein